MSRVREFLIRRGIKKVLKTLLRYNLHLKLVDNTRLFIVANEDDHYGIELEGSDELE